MRGVCDIPRFAPIITVLLVANVLTGQCEGLTQGALSLSPPLVVAAASQPYGISDEDTIRLLQDFESGCRASLARGEDISEALLEMSGIARRSQVAAHNYLAIMEGLLPLLPEPEVQAEQRIMVSSIHHMVGQHEQADALLHDVIAAYPDPTSELGRKGRYVLASHEVARGDVEEAQANLEVLWGVADKYDERVFRRIGSQLAEVYSRQGDWEGVIRVGVPALPEVMSETDLSPMFYYKVARAYQETGGFDTAISYFQEIADFLDDLEARGIKHKVVSDEFRRQVEKGITQSRLGLQTAEYQRQHEENVIEDAIASAMIHAVVEDAATEIVSGMDRDEVAGSPALVSERTDSIEEEATAQAGLATSWRIAAVAALLGLAAVAAGAWLRSRKGMNPPA